MRPHRQPFRRPLVRRLRLELLEDRRLLTAFVVDSLDDVVAADGDLTLREALEAANANAKVADAPAGSSDGVDRIFFAPSLFGTGKVRILLDGQRLEISDDVEIQGPGSELLWIDAGRRSRVFYITEGTTVVISGVTITGGFAEDLDQNDGVDESGEGGGIYNGRGTLTLRDAALRSNEATWNGGGIYNDRGTLTIDDSAVLSNQVLRRGAGVFSEGGTVDVTGSTFSYNWAGDYGGGVFSSGRLTVSNSDFADGYAAVGSGIGNTGTLKVADSTFSDNSGSAIDNQQGTAEVTRSTIRANAAPGRYGAGIFNSAVLTVTQSTIVGNSAGDAGGIYNNQGTVTLVNSVLAANSATDDGGAIFNHRGTLNITSSTIAGNFAENDGGGIGYNDGSLTLTNSMLANKSGGSGTDVEVEMTAESQFNLIGDDPDPMFLRNPGPGPDERWGTADDDFGDVRLRPGSPAIDAGQNGLLPSDTFDLDGDGDTAEPLPISLAGNPRVMAGDENGVEKVDLGAFEKNPYHNDADPLDVDGDGYISPLDALLIINMMNAGGAGPLAPPVGPVAWYLDINNDGILSPIDALAIINELNARLGESEPLDGLQSPATSLRPNTRPTAPSIFAVASPMARDAALDHVIAESPLPMSSAQWLRRRLIP